MSSLTLYFHNDPFYMCGRIVIGPISLSELLVRSGALLRTELKYEVPVVRSNRPTFSEKQIVHRLFSYSKGKTKVFFETDRIIMLEHNRKVIYMGQIVLYNHTTNCSIPVQ